MLSNFLRTQTAFKACNTLLLMRHSTAFFSQRFEKKLDRKILMYENLKDQKSDRESEVKKKHVKSISSKLRHASKTEHHNFDYDEATGRLKRTDRGIESLNHTATDNEFIFSLFMNKPFQAYLHRHYQIVPVLITRKKIRRVRSHPLFCLQFVNEIQHNPQYDEHILKWQTKSKEEKVDLRNLKFYIAIKFKQR